MPDRSLTRSLGWPGATLLGLGSILGTGVFVSIGLAAGVAGGWVVLATILAGLVATANALSSAQLAAAHPVSGGTYEYGYRWLSPPLGFAAGWMFLAAKSASAATAALGFAGYTLALLGHGSPAWTIALALAAVAALTLLVLSGLRRSSLFNAIIVGLVIAALAAFIATAGAWALQAEPAPTLGLDRPIGPGFLEATALMFVAFTGYGRIATLGEEVRDPARTIPRAIIVTLMVSAILYAGVAAAAVAALGAEGLSSATIAGGAPLEAAAGAIGQPWLGVVVALGAIAAMLGVLLNLILGLSRVTLAMGRRGDLPEALARIDARGNTPWIATIAVGVVIAIIASIGSIRLAWSFSAFTVLVYYAITHLAALRLAPEHRLFPRWIAWTGLCACLGLAWWVDPRVWLTGLGTLAAGFGVRWAVRRFARRSGDAAD